MTPISLITTQDIDGCVKINPAWEGLDSIARVDLLMDWISVLEQLRSFAHHDAWGMGYEHKKICVQSISGWDYHGKSPEDYPPTVLRSVKDINP